jgi:hypothetical protein
MKILKNILILAVMAMGLSLATVFGTPNDEAYCAVIN